MASTVSMFRSISCILLALIICLWNAPSPALSQEGCDPRDQRALLQIKQELGNPSLLSSWDPTTSDCCSNNWQDVMCTNYNRVHYLALNGLDLPSPVNFPPSITNLPYLDQLILMNMPNLTGSIPRSITKLTKLEVFYLYKTNVSGPIPPFLAQIKTLWSLAFGYNNFTGRLPASLPQLPNVGVISISGNRLKGPIPDSYGYFPKSLSSLTLSHNKLSGKIPASLGRLEVGLLDLSANKLEGDASMLFGAEKSTQEINLSRNKLAFDFGKVEFGRNISNLHLKYNRIYGRLPEGLTKLQHLRRFNVSYNDLCGEIPQGGTGRLQSFFTAWEYSHNKCLCGSPLPSCK